jgi:serine/threonine-protein kinase
MDAARWTQIQTLFEAALERKPAERAAFLQTACADDPDLLAEVRSLLAADADAHPMLDSLALDAIALPSDLLPAGILPSKGERVGPYRIVEPLGQGGMGAVFLAERADGQFEQQVALKLIRGGAASEQIVRRFQSERQILARLQHPHIARLLDGGLTEDGQPYFAMEYVDGVPLDQYCAARDCSVAERLRLIQTVCEAVQYAHRRLIVHRDLKPSNILVIPDDSGTGSGGTVKLLDFGIAKVLTGEDDANASPALTQTGRAVMTPAYAAPEQVRHAAVTTATDVYALGVVLYELLAGERPFALAGRSPAEVERIVCERAPEPPSSVAPSDRQRALRGDLDTIVLKALRKEPERRYTSAEQLADDLQRYLDGRPVEARPDTVGYRTRKFVQRHRVGVAATAAVVSLIAALVSFYTIQLAQERDRAQLEAETATQVSTFLQDVFQSSDPSEAMGDTISVRTVLERGAQRIDTDLDGQPVVQARLLDVMGEVYLNLGQYDKAQPMLERALALRREAHGETHADVASSMDHLALLHEKTGTYEEAEQLNRRALSLRRTLYGDDHPAVAESLNRLAGLLMHKGDYEEAEPLYRQSLAIRQGLLEDDHPEVAVTMNDLALLLHRRGKLEEAEQYARQSLALNRKQYGENPHPNVTASIGLLGALLEDKGEYAAAEDVHREALAMSHALYGDEPHPLVATSLNNLAGVLRIRGKYDEALPLLREATAIDRRLHGDEHLNVATGLNSLALLLEDMGRYGEAEQYSRETLRVLRATVGDEHPYVAFAINNLGMLLFRVEDYSAAEPLLRQSLALRQTLYDDAHPNIATAMHNVGALLHRTGEYAEAERLLRQALALRRDIYGDEHPEVATSLDGLGWLLHDTGAYDEAVPLLRQALTILRASQSNEHRQTATVAYHLASALRAEGAYAEAEPLYQEALATLRVQLGDTHKTVQTIVAELSALYEAWGQPDRAAAYRDQLAAGADSTA